MGVGEDRWARIQNKMEVGVKKKKIESIVYEAIVVVVAAVILLSSSTVLNLLPRLGGGWFLVFNVWCLRLLPTLYCV